MIDVIHCRIWWIRWARQERKTRETMESLPVPLSLGNWPSLMSETPNEGENTVKLIKKSRKMIQGEFCNVFLFQDPKFEKTTHEVIEITPDYYMVNIDGDGFGISTTLTPEERGFKDYQTAINKTNR